MGEEEDPGDERPDTDQPREEHHHLLPVRGPPTGASAGGGAGGRAREARGAGEGGGRGFGGNARGPGGGNGGPDSEAPGPGGGARGSAGGVGEPGGPARCSGRDVRGPGGAGGYVGARGGGGRSPRRAGRTGPGARTDARLRRTPVTGQPPRVLDGRVIVADGGTGVGAGRGTGTVTARRRIPAIHPRSDRAVAGAGATGAARVAAGTRVRVAPGSRTVRCAVADVGVRVRRLGRDRRRDSGGAGDPQRGREATALPGTGSRTLLATLAIGRPHGRPPGGTTSRPRGRGLAQGRTTSRPLGTAGRARGHSPGLSGLSGEVAQGRPGLRHVDGLDRVVVVRLRLAPGPFGPFPQGGQGAGVGARGLGEGDDRALGGEEPAAQVALPGRLAVARAVGQRRGAQAIAVGQLPQPDGELPHLRVQILRQRFPPRHRLPPLPLFPRLPCRSRGTR